MLTLQILSSEVSKYAKKGKLQCKHRKTLLIFISSI
ncbi:unnamed protein product [Haemonchus placei]|uniref:Uncharacterized protein n=1 Tax=Haemonchus placei TaxID=6290 RepID=A0A0N4X107_HAEPC|nr:unnamed protein product [Haemonchus placei]